MKEKSRFLDVLAVERIDDINFKIINHPFRYYSMMFNGVISVPVGFKTDFSSTWSHKWAKRQGAIHDYLYYIAITTRTLADAIYREAMLIDENWKVRSMAWVYWSGLRLFGWVAWNKHRKQGHRFRP